MKTTTVIVFLMGSLFGGVAESQEISPILFGQNHWMADGDEGRVGYLHELWDKVAESGVQCVRIGGNGYQQKFPTRPELDEMIDRIRGAGTLPILQVPSIFTVLQVKELVEYYSTPEGREVEIWSIGNEPFLHKEFSLEEVHTYIVRIATAMKEVNPDIEIYFYDAAWLQMDEFEALCGGGLAQ